MRDADESTPIQVLLVEDDDELRAGLAVLINGTPGFVCSADFRSVEAALAHAVFAAPDVVLLDINLPGMSGIEGVPRLKERFPQAVVLMLTVYADDRFIFAAICNGASGYLLKGTSPGRILDAIREAAGGGGPMSPQIAARVMALFRRTAVPADPESPLTAREQSLLGLLAEGHSYQSAAEAMEISINTVRKHVRSVYEKLHVHTRAQAVSKALRAGLLERE